MMIRSGYPGGGSPVRWMRVIRRDKVKVALVLFALIVIGLLISPFAGLLIVPMWWSGVVFHEVAHYIPLKPWDKGLYLEVWPFVDLTDREADFVVGHVGGEFDDSIPKPYLLISFMGPYILYGIPLAILSLSTFHGLNDFLGFLWRIPSSTFHYLITVFVIQLLQPSGADIHHLRNTEKIKNAGTLEMEVWDK